MLRIFLVFVCLIGAGALQYAAAMPLWKPAPDQDPKSGLPDHMRFLVDLPDGSVTAMATVAAKASAQTPQITLPDGTHLLLEGIQQVRHANGDVTHSSSLAGAGAGAGASYPISLTVGRSASYGSWVTPRGRYRFESHGQQGWLVALDHPGLEHVDSGDDAVLPPGFRPPVAHAAPKMSPTVIDILILYTAGYAARHPGDAVVTRLNHLVASANQAFANSNVDAVLRPVAYDLTGYTDSNDNAVALDDMVRQLQTPPVPGGEPFAGLRERRDILGADLVALLRPHDLRARASCGIAYLFGNGREFAASVSADGISTWSICSEHTFVHEIGHNLGAEHQRPFTSQNATFNTALAAPARFSTVMASFGTGEVNRPLDLNRFSNPDQFCGGARCGVSGQSDNARRLRETIGAVAAYSASSSTVPVPTQPAADDPDVDGDGVAESLDAFPFDPRYSVDSDADGVPDTLDAFPSDPSEQLDTDGDGVGDNTDPDIDGDGVPNTSDAFPLDPTESGDTDGDRVGDNADAFPANPREWADSNADGTGDNESDDADGDGLNDFASSTEATGFDLLVVSAGNDRVLRIDGSTGLLVAVEVDEDDEGRVFEPGGGPQILGPNSSMVWDAHSGRLHLLVDSELRRYDAASRRRVDTFLRARATPLPQLPTAFPAAMTLLDPYVFVADGDSGALFRFDFTTGNRVPGGDLERPGVFAGETRALATTPDGRVWSVEPDGRLVGFNAGSGQNIAVHRARIDGVPLGEAVDLAATGSGKLLIADTGLDAVVRFDPAAPSDTSVLVASGTGGLSSPGGIAMGPDGLIYLSSQGNDSILRFNADDGRFVDRFDRLPPGSLSQPRQLRFVPKVLDRYPTRPDRRYRPVAGGWYNPARSGHGIDLQVVDDRLSVIWYTYEADGSPTWYLGTGEIRHGTWEAPLLRFVWDGSTATATTVGSATLLFEAERRAQFSWQLPEGEGSETFQPIPVGSAVETQFPTAAWYPPGASGWGLSVTRQGESDYAIAFIYDEAGNPRWTLGVGTRLPDGVRYAMQSFEGPTRCPGCGGDAAPSSAPAGSMTLYLRPDGSARVDADLQSAELLWQRETVEFTRLTETPTTEGGGPRP